MTEKIIDKIKKLLNLSQDNSNENEAATAAAAAQKLMLKYNISKALIQSVDNIENLRSEIVHIFVPVSEIWESSLAEEIAENSDVYIVGLLNAKNEISSLKVYGKEESVLVFEATFEFLKNELTKILNNKYLAVSTKSKNWCKTFYFAAIAAIGKRLKEEKDKTIEEVKKTFILSCEEKGLSIVHVSNAIQKVENIRQELEKMLEGETQEQKLEQENIDVDALIKGYKEGSLMNLRRTSLESGNKLEEK